MLPLVLMLAATPADDPPKAKLPIGKDTTVVEGPLDKDGYIDYEAALNARLSKGVTPDTNAVVLIWRAIGPTPEFGRPQHPDFWKQLGVAEPPADGAYFQSLEAFMKARGRAVDNDVYDTETRLTTAPWTAADQPDFAAWLAANEKPLALVVEAGRRPGYYNPVVARDKNGKPSMLIGALLPAVQKCRSLGTALVMRAMLRAGDGKFDEAWADILAVHRLARHVARGGTLIELLVGYALDAVAARTTAAFIAARKPTAAQAAAAIRDLDALPPMPTPAEKIDLAERFTYLDVVQWTRRGGTDTLEGLAGGKGGNVPAKDAEKLMAALDWVLILQQGNHWYDRTVAALKLPTRAARKAALAAIEKDFKAMKAGVAAKAGEVQAAIEAGGDVEPAVRTAVSEAIGGMVVGLMMPAAEKVQVSADRHAQQLRLTRLAFALAAHRADAGAYPETLAALAPKYVTSVEPDLFADKPLVYKRTADGYLLYSVGPNEKDDEGRLSTSDPKGDDIAVRMPPAGT